MPVRAMCRVSEQRGGLCPEKPRRQLRKSTAGCGERATHQTMSTVLLRRKEASNRVAPVRELFAHVSEMRPLRTALIAADKQGDFVEMGQGYFARAIERRLAEWPASSAIVPAQRTAMAHAFAGALLSVLSWWIDQASPDSPEAMDNLYHVMVWSGVASRSACDP
jgi:hypothetical protein